MFVYPKLIHHNRSHAIAYSTALVGTKLACFAIMINCSRFLIVIWSKNEHTFFKTVIGLLVVKVDWVLRYILGVDFDFWSFNLVLIYLEHKVFVILFSNNTLGCSDDRLIDQASDVPSIIFFHDFLQNSLQKYFQSICLFF